MFQLRICFVDSGPMDYTAESPYLIPLGGSQSALCYLTAALAERGHAVTLLNNTSTPGLFRGVECLTLPEEPEELFLNRTFDAVISLNSLLPMSTIRPHLPPNTPLLLWTQHTAEDVSMLALQHRLVQEAWDSFIFVSRWQQANYIQRFGLQPERTCIRRNAIAPAFAYLFADKTQLVSTKAKTPTLAYTSVPNRGLAVLLDIFPLLREIFPQLQLQVFSSLQTYQEPEDDPALQALYQRCRETENVSLRGSLPQPELALELSKAHLLAYPNTFAETSCISAMEAMACGCDIITTQMGALPETTAGFARLVPPEPHENYARRYLSALTDALMLWLKDPQAVVDRLSNQVMHTSRRNTWPVRIWEWESLLFQRCRNPKQDYWPEGLPRLKTQAQP
jgi:glycosyltransferase involved in cell wall biosynthesis